MEPVEVKLARIEEGMVALHGKVDSYHATVSKKMEKVDSHEVKLEVMKRDNWWFMVLAGFCSSAFTSALLKYLK